MPTYHAFWSPSGKGVEHIVSAGTRREALALAEDRVSQPRDGSPYTYTPHVYVYADSRLPASFRRALEQAREDEIEWYEIERFGF